MGSREIITFNLRGTRFQTIRRTLKNFPSQLQRWIDLDGCPQNEDKNGDIFIDRDPKHFHKIINAMRYKKFDGDMTKEVVEELKAELKYYKLEWLRNELNSYSASFGKKDVTVVEPVTVEWKEQEDAKNGYRFLKSNSELVPLLMQTMKVGVFPNAARFCVYRYVTPAKNAFDFNLKRMSLWDTVRTYQTCVLFVFVHDGDSDDNSVNWPLQFYPSESLEFEFPHREGMTIEEEERREQIIKYWNALQEAEDDGEDYFIRQKRILGKFYVPEQETYGVNLVDLRKVLQL